MIFPSLTPLSPSLGRERIKPALSEVEGERVGYGLQVTSYMLQDLGI